MNPPFQVVCADKELEYLKIHWGQIYTVAKVSQSQYNGREYDIFYLQDDGQMTTTGGHYRHRFRDLEEMQAVNFLPLCQK